MLTREELIERVECGIAYLDKNDGEWAKEIDVNKLDIESGRNCVIGQLDKKEFYYARRERKLSFTDIEMLGFHLGDYNERFKWNWTLTEIWKEKIKERQQCA